MRWSSQSSDPVESSGSSGPLGIQWITGNSLNEMQIVLTAEHMNNVLVPCPKGFKKTSTDIMINIFS
ncbi:hypothetical protein HGM15179_014295 [Zosterops borbonicus]|uniref:Uncharacterized protein n=1 Tax=Zosterops borbonicus TaxID=364589 RepID=A0A8K1G7C9_9PASS|nr:hypothetical protein HGM15179_014295 [Zosterops borbonicus]